MHVPLHSLPRGSIIAANGGAVFGTTERAHLASPPTGTVTFLFTDIEASTRRWERHPSPPMRCHVLVHVNKRT